MRQDKTTEVTYQGHSCKVKWTGYVDWDKLAAFLVENGTATGIDLENRSWSGSQRHGFAVATGPGQMDFALMPSAGYMPWPTPSWEKKAELPDPNDHHAKCRKHLGWPCNCSKDNRILVTDGVGRIEMERLVSRAVAAGLDRYFRVEDLPGGQYRMSMRAVTHIAGSSWQPKAEPTLEKMESWITRNRSWLKLRLVREPDNEHDRNAVGVWFMQVKLGYVPKQDAGTVARVMDNGVEVRARYTGLKQMELWWPASTLVELDEVYQRAMG